MNHPLLVLRPKRDASILRQHPWVFSGAINKIVLSEDQEDLKEGDVVTVCNHKEEVIATGHFGMGSIAVRILSFNDRQLDQSFWNSKIEKAFQLRQALGLLDDNKHTNAYRLVHAEGDGLAGLIIDIYDKVVVVQAHSLGMANSLEMIAEALRNVMPNQLEAIYSKSEKSLHRQGSESVKDDFLFGALEAPQLVLENQLKFEIDWITGQKTGFFIDQRENRKLLQRYSNGKKVLNTFCYSGGFSIYALAANAEMVHSVDSSAKAIELTDRNVELNFGSSQKHQSFVQDTLSYLNETEEEYDTIILDPPAYAKSKSALHKAVQGYKRLNEKAFKMIKPGGVLFTFSCSQVVNRKLFEDTITAAAIAAGRSVKIIHHLSQPADHPVNIAHPEGEYLKGLVLYVES